MLDKGSFSQTAPLQGIISYFLITLQWTCLFFRVHPKPSQDVHEVGRERDLCILSHIFSRTVYSAPDKANQIMGCP